MVGVFDQRTIIDDVAGKQDAARPLEQRDAAGRVTGRVDYLEMPVAEIDDVAALRSRVAGAAPTR